MILCRNRPHGIQCPWGHIYCYASLHRPKTPDELQSVEYSDKINQTHEYIGILHELNRKTDEGFTNYKKQKELMEQIDYLDIYINSLSVQADNLLEEINLVEKKINESKN